MHEAFGESDSTSHDRLMSRRKPWVIVLLALLGGPFALVYGGHLRRAMAWWGLYWLACCAAGLVTLYFPGGRWGFAGGAFIMLLAFGALVLDAIRCGKQQQGQAWRPYQRWWGYSLLFITFAIVGHLFSLMVSEYWIEAFVLPSNGMRETLIAGDRFMVDKLFVNMKQPTRGSVVVFQPPIDQQTIYVQRLVAIPGDTVSIINDQVFVNGKLLDEPYALFLDEYSRNLQYNLQLQNSPEVEVPAGHVFVLGDNRWSSNDSRIFGMLPIENLIGVARQIFWSRECEVTYPTRENPVHRESWGDLRWDRVGRSIK